MKRLPLVIGLALALAGAAAYHFGLTPWPGGKKAIEQSGRRGAGPSRGENGPVMVTTALVREADVPVTIDAVGTVQAYNTVTVRTQVDGRLVKLAFSEGQDVRKNDMLALIDPTVYQAAYDQAVAKKAQDEANLANARVDLARYQKLAANNYVAQQQLSTQKAQVTQLEAQIRGDQGAIDNARAMLDFATIRSPIDGRTGIRLVDEGNILHASDQAGIVVITQLKPIYVVFAVPQQALPAVQKAQGARPAKAVALGPDNATALGEGRVAVIDNQVDQLTGTVRVKASFENEKLSLWPGQFVNVRVTVDTIKQALVVPSTAVQRGPNGPFVYVLSEDQTVLMKPVTITQQDEARAVIASGLELSQNVVTSGFGRLTDGARAQTAAAAPAAEAEGVGASGPDAKAPAPEPLRGDERKRGQRDGARKR